MRFFLKWQIFMSRTFYSYSRGEYTGCGSVFGLYTNPVFSCTTRLSKGVQPEKSLACYMIPHISCITCNSPAIFCNTRENVGRQRRFPGSEGTISCKNSTIRQINAPHSSCRSLPHKNTVSRMLCLRKE